MVWMGGNGRIRGVRECSESKKSFEEQPLFSHKFPPSHNREKSRVFRSTNPRRRRSANSRAKIIHFIVFLLNVSRDNDRRSKFCRLPRHNTQTTCLTIVNFVGNTQSERAFLRNPLIMKLLK